MTVDLNSRVWDSTARLGPAIEQQMRRRLAPWQTPEASTDAHERAMAQVTAAVVLGFESTRLGASIPHESVARTIERDRARFIGFAGIDPTAGIAGDSLKRAVDLGLSGVTVNPPAAGFHPADTRAMSLYEQCVRHGLPVYIEADPMLARDVRMEFGQPYMVDEVALALPELRIAISSMGHPWIDQGLALIGKHPTVFADLSDLVRRPWQLYNVLLLAHQQGVTGQILFASGFPFCNPSDATVAIYSINALIQGTHLPPVPREPLRGIVERDALVSLGIRRADAPPRPSAPAMEESTA